MHEAEGLKAVISMATYLAVAASFWVAHGQPVAKTPQWSWDDNNLCVDAACSEYGTPDAPGHIYFKRDKWDRLSAVNKCVVVIHEKGHADYGMHHQLGGIMDGTSKVFDYVPGECTSPPIYRRAWVLRLY